MDSLLCDCKNCQDNYEKALKLKMAPSYEELEDALRHAVSLVHERVVEHTRDAAFNAWIVVARPSRREIAASLGISARVVEHLYPKESPR